MIQATPELKLAVNQFVQQAINSIMGASNLLISTLGGGGPLPEGVSQKVVVQAGGTSVISPTVLLQHEAELPSDRLRQGNLDAMHEFIFETAESYANQFAEPLNTHFDEALAAVGNSIQLKKDDFSWDTILDALEKVDWLPIDGTVRQPAMHIGSDLRAVLEAQGEPTDAHQERLEGIFQRKQEEHVSRRRSRRLY
ncbi:MULTISPECIES: hypothetical protein [Rhodococcus]|uniref:Uncharacterized protein n=1 Tax=Rhodococcus qingshengii JCM 15477 TaxID=1303681 RepID=A0AB38RMR4_RHOSG|nr:MULTISPECIES: hypothetical protein [Rhodococcus]MDA3637534.1 hypothetical protein [Rhodococcus sp. C-2]UPU46652.1 hypothetical protein M0639_31050 [Rhodococcus qingshengii JCM 15477]